MLYSAPISLPAIRPALLPFCEEIGESSHPGTAHNCYHGGDYIHIHRVYLFPSLFVHCPWLPPIAGAMNYSRNPDFIAFNPVHDAISTIEDLACIRLVDFGNDAAQQRELLQAICRFHQPADEQRCHFGRVSRYELSNRGNIVKGRWPQIT